MARVLGHNLAGAGLITDEIITTADLLAIRGKSLLSASGAEFEYAADLARGWNAFMSERPIVLDWVTQ